MLLLPQRPTFKRWLKLSSPQYSILRALEYERIAGLELHGLILDVGGGLKNSYYSLLNINGKIESINIDPNIQPTYIGDLNGSLAIESERYDTLICFNTLEHIDKDFNALCEMCRVLKAGGETHIIVPFLYRVHGSPYDFHRHTATAWLAILERAGFDPQSIQIEPLVFGGALTSAFSFVEFMFPKPLHWLLRKLVLFVAVLKAQWLSAADFPLGYYILVRKFNVIERHTHESV